MSLDTAVDDLTVAFPGTGLVFYWKGLQAGWPYAMLVATADGCGSVSTAKNGGTGADHLNPTVDSDPGTPLNPICQAL